MALSHQYPSAYPVLCVPAYRPFVERGAKETEVVGAGVPNDPPPPLFFGGGGGHLRQQLLHGATQGGCVSGCSLFCIIQINQNYPPPGPAGERGGEQ